MENADSQDTLPNLETILKAINGLRQEVNDSINGLRQELNDSINGLRQEINERFDKVEVRLTVVEGDVQQIKEMMFVFENEFDRLLALSYKSLELSHENRADVRIMRKEITAWANDVLALERRIV